ncbi:MAG: abortive infection protein [Bacteroidetes bacterium MedPE-SWsnd-G2]|nr:MAG: abortive infection protein [Bacteroidetes bacterium MedPE-SWsnd-G2]
MNTQTKTYKLFEFLISFVVIPVSFYFSFNPLIKVALGLFGFVYILFMLLRVEHLKFKMAPNLKWRVFWKNTAIKLFVIMLLTTGYVFIFDKAHLFDVLINKPLLWINVVVAYSVFSVYPQELIFRTFYFQRYKRHVKNDFVFILVNALVFSLAHLFFKSVLVHVMTFIGGVLFALTYRKTNSTLLVSIEHAIYGSWLFTVGMGNMLGFPS